MEDLRGLRCGRMGSSAGDVRGALLGEKPRYAPDRDFDTLHVRLELSVDFKRSAVDALCATTVKSFGALRRLRLDAREMRISSVRAAGRPAPFTHKEGVLEIALPKALGPGEEAGIEVRYRLTRPRLGLRFVPASKATRNRWPQLFSHGQPDDTRCWFPCHDAPHEKATSEMLVSVPKGWCAVSNGVLQERRASGGRETFHWRMDHPHSLYLVSLAAGRFSEVRDDWDGVRVSYFCEKGREEDAARGFSLTPRAMALYSRLFGVRYPYEKYAQVAISRFPAGGMEHTTATTQTDACLIDDAASLDNDMDLLVAHELAHQWFGDLVTCRDWSHAWLNEGFATYAEYLFLENERGRDDADYELAACASACFREEDERYRRPIVCNTYKYPNVLFDRHLYEKAACVLHMLRAELGEAAWRKSLAHYLRRHRNGSVETSDLVSAIEDCSGRNLRWFFDQWIFRPGHPSLRVYYRFDPRRRSAEMRVRQTQKDAPYRLPAHFRFSGEGGRWTKEFRELVDKKEHTFTFRLPSEPAMAEFDPEHRLLAEIETHKPLGLWLGELFGAALARGRIQAARALARWGDAQCARALGAAFRREPFWGAAAEMAKALGSIGTEEALRQLKSLLGVPHPKARRAVAAALGEFRSCGAAPELFRLLRTDPSLNVRAEAARALGRSRDPRWGGAFKKLMREPSYWDILACGAIEGMARTRDIGVLPALRRASGPRASHPARSTALRALGPFVKNAPEVLGWIAASLDDPDERVALASLQALSTSGAPAALPILESFLKRTPHERLKVQAEEAIARLKPETA